MSHTVNSYPYTFVGILLIFIGWFSIISGIFGFFNAQDLLVITFQLESMFVDTTLVSESQILFNMSLRIILGVIIVFFGNEFLARGLESHRLLHPRFNDFRRLR